MPAPPLIRFSGARGRKLTVSAIAAAIASTGASTATSGTSAAAAGRGSCGAFDAGRESVERDGLLEPALFVVEGLQAGSAVRASGRVSGDRSALCGSGFTGPMPAQRQVADMFAAQAHGPPRGEPSRARAPRWPRCAPTACGRWEPNARWRRPPRPGSCRRRSNEWPPAASPGPAPQKLAHRLAILEQLRPAVPFTASPHLPLEALVPGRALRRSRFRQ